MSTITDRQLTITVKFDSSDAARAQRDATNQFRGTKIPLEFETSQAATRILQELRGQLASLVPLGRQASAAADFSRTGRSAASALPGISSLSGSLRVVTVNAHEATEGLERFASGAGLAARRFLAFGAGAGAILQLTSAIRAGFTEAVNFEREMVKLAQVSEEAQNKVADVGREISRLSTSFGVSSRELAQAAVVFRQAGLSIDDTRVALEGIAKAALAPNFDSLKSTAEGAIAVMRQFGVGARDLEGALGSINAVAGAFAVESRDLIEVVQKTGGAFKQTGGELNELLALFTAVRSTTRESASEISTGLRTIFSRLQSPQTVEALRAMGVELRHLSADSQRLAGNNSLEGQFVGAYEAVRRLSEGLSSLQQTDPRYSAIVEQLGGYRQISRVLPLISQFGEAQRALNVAQTGGISLAVSAEKAQESLAVKASKTKEEFLALGRTLLDDAGIKGQIELVLKLTDTFIGLAGALRPLIPLLSGLAIGAVVRSAVSGGATAFASQFAGTAPSSRLLVAANGPTRRPTGFATGGFVVPGVGDSDSVPMDLPAGSFVVKKSSARAVGYDNLAALAGGRRSASALLTPGEFVYGPGSAQRVGPGRLNRLNFAGGGLSQLPAGDHLSLEEILGAIDNSPGVASGSTFDQHGVKYAGRPYARELAARTFANTGALRFLPKGSQFLGSGIAGIAFRTPDGDVIRAQAGSAQKQALGLIRSVQQQQVQLGLKVRDNLSPTALGVKRPDAPEVLQPTDKLSIGSPAGRVVLEKLPFAEDVGSPAEARQAISSLRGDLLKRGLEFTDAHRGNIGRVPQPGGGYRYVVRDPGAVSPVYTGPTSLQGPEPGSNDPTVVRRSTGGGVDSVHALLTPKEFVFKPEAVASIGVPNLAYMNATGRLPARFARGGLVGDADASPQRFAFGDFVIPDLEAKRKAYQNEYARKLAEAQAKGGVDTKLLAEGVRKYELDSPIINKSLRGGQPQNDPSLSTLYDFLSKSSFDKDTTLYRGVRSFGLTDIAKTTGIDFANQSASSLAGKTFQDSGVTSTSLERGVAEKFATGALKPGDPNGKVFRINVQKGQPGGLIGNDKELEVGLPPGGQYRVAANQGKDPRVIDLDYLGLKQLLKGQSQSPGVSLGDESLKPVAAEITSALKQIGVPQAAGPADKELKTVLADIKAVTQSGKLVGLEHGPVAQEFIIRKAVEESSSLKEAADQKSRVAELQKSEVVKSKPGALDNQANVLAGLSPQQAALFAKHYGVVNKALSRVKGGRDETGELESTATAALASAIIENEKNDSGKKFNPLGYVQAAVVSKAGNLYGTSARKGRADAQTISYSGLAGEASPLENVAARSSTGSGLQGVGTTDLTGNEVYQNAVAFAKKAGLSTAGKTGELLARITAHQASGGSNGPPRPPVTVAASPAPDEPGKPGFLTTAVTGIADFDASKLTRQARADLARNLIEAAKEAGKLQQLIAGDVRAVVSESGGLFRISGFTPNPRAQGALANAANNADLEAVSNRIAGEVTRRGFQRSGPANAGVPVDDGKPPISATHQRRLDILSGQTFQFDVNGGKGGLPSYVVPDNRIPLLPAGSSARRQQRPASVLPGTRETYDVAGQEPFAFDVGPVRTRVKASPRLPSYAGGPVDPEFIGKLLTSRTEDALGKPSFFGLGAARTRDADGNVVVSGQTRQAERNKQGASLQAELEAAERANLRSLYPQLAARERNKLAQERVNDALYDQDNKLRENAKVLRDASGKQFLATKTVSELEAQGKKGGGASFADRAGVSGFLGGFDPNNRFGKFLNSGAAKLGSGAALITLPYLAQSIANGGGTAEQAVAGSGNERGFRDANIRSGFIQGAVTGLAFGSAFGAHGAGIGAVVGAGVGANQAASQADTDLRSARTNNAINLLVEKSSILATAGAVSNPEVVQSAREQLGIIDTQNNLGNREVARKFSLAGLANGIGEYFSPSTGFGRRPGEAGLGAGYVDPVRLRELNASSSRRELAGLLPQFTQFLQAQAVNLGRNANGRGANELLAEFQNGNGGFNRELLNRTAGLRGQTGIEATREIRVAIERGVRQDVVEREQRGVQGETVRNVNSFGRLLLAVQAAADSISLLQTKSQALAEQFDGTIGALQINLKAENLNQLGRLDRGALEPLQTLANTTGGPGAAALEYGGAVDQLKALLPTVLANAASKNQSQTPGDLATTVRRDLLQQLGHTEQSAPAYIKQGLNSISSFLNIHGDKPQELYTAIGADAGHVSSQAIESFSRGIGPIAEAVKGLQAAANSAIASINAIPRQNRAILEGRGRGDTITLEGQRQQAQFAAEDAGRKHSALDFISLQQLQTPYRATQERLAGVAGAGAFDPNSLARRLKETEDAIPAAIERQQREAQNNPTSDRFREAAIALNTLRERAANLQGALQHLANASERNAGAQEKLAALRQEESSRLGLAERYFTAEPNERNRLDRGFTLASSVLSGGQRVENLTADDRRAISESLHAAGSATLTGLRGSPTGTEALEQILRLSGGGNSFGLNPQQQAERRALQASITTGNQGAQQASQALVEAQVRNSNGLLQSILTTLETQLAALNQNLTRATVGDLQNQVASTGVRRGELRTRQTQAGLLAGIGITDDTQLAAFQANQSQLGAYGDAIRRRQLGQGLAATVTNQGFFTGRGGAVDNLLNSGGGSTRPETITQNVINALESHFGPSGSGQLSPDQITAIAANFETNYAPDLIQRFGRGDRGGTTSGNYLVRRVGLRSAQLETQEGVQQYVGEAIQDVVGGRGNAQSDRDYRRFRGTFGGIRGLNLGNLETILGGPEAGRTQFTAAAAAFNPNDPARNLANLGTQVSQTEALFNSLNERLRVLNETLGGLPGGSQGAANFGGGATGGSSSGNAPFNPLDFFNPQAFGFADGGQVWSGRQDWGPRGTDTIPAWLSPNEYVVNADSTRHNLDLLHAINRTRGPIYREGGGPTPLVTDLPFANGLLPESFRDRLLNFQVEQRLRDQLGVFAGRVGDAQISGVREHLNSNFEGGSIAFVRQASENRVIGGPVEPNPQDVAINAAQQAGAAAGQNFDFLQAARGAVDVAQNAGRFAGQQANVERRLRLSAALTPGGQSSLLLTRRATQNRLRQVRAAQTANINAELRAINGGSDNGAAATPEEQLYHQRLQLHRGFLVAQAENSGFDINESQFQNGYAGAARRQRTFEDNVLGAAAQRTIRSANRANLRRQFGLANLGESGGAFGLGRADFNQQGQLGASLLRAQQPFLDEAANQDYNYRRFLARQVGPQLIGSQAGIRGFAEGGEVRGGDSGGRSGDSVPAMLTPGEIVMSRAAVNAFGQGNLLRANRFAQGGLVGGGSGGDGASLLNTTDVAKAASSIELAATNFGQHAQTFSQAVTAFSGAALELARAINNMPKNLTMEATHIFGGSIGGVDFNKLDGRIEELAKAILSKGLKGLIQQMPESGLQTPDLE